MDALPVTVRKSWIGLVGIALGAIASIGLILWGAWSAAGIPYADKGVLFAIAVLVVALVAAFFIVWMYVYSLSYVELTTDGLKAVNWKSLFNKQTVEQEWVRVQNVAAVQSGIFATMLNFGTLIIPSAGTIEALKMVMVPNVEHWQKVIMTYADMATQDGMDVTE